MKALVVLNDPVPPRPEKKHAQLNTRIVCSNGVEDFVARPLSADELEPGQHRRITALFSHDEWPDGFHYPCDVEHEFVRWDAYDRTPEVLQRSCLTDRGVRAGRCDQLQ